MKANKISLKNIFKRFRWKIIFTWLLVIFEAGLFLLFPLVMGMAIDDIIKGAYLGIVVLGGVALLSLLVGSGRRFYDTRIYSKIYAIISPELVEKEKKRNASVSVISAKANLATEFVEFLENGFPDIITSIIGLGGTLVIILFLNVKVFIACMIASLIIMVIYSLTSKKTYFLNKNFNQELEKQVSVLEENNKTSIITHFKNIVKWNIKLSDLETVNFSVSWLFLMAVLLYSIFATIESGITAHGKILAIVMYVFNYIESVIAIPLYYQQFVRLKEISHRLESSESNT